MGIQSWKRGVHTGNTIRVGGTSAQKRCVGNQSVLIKRQVDPPTQMGPFLEEEEERKRVRRRSGRTKKVTHEAKQFVEVEELNDLEENVVYSLNKKGRWNLPETIRTEIKHSKCMPKDQPDVRNRRSATHDERKLDEDLTMVQCHALKRGSNCVAVTSTKLPGDGTVSKTKNYLNVNSVLQKKTRFKVRPNRTRKGATPQVEKTQEKPTTEIEVSTPYPRNSYLQYAENSRNSWPIRKDTRQPSRGNLSSEEICDIMKIDSCCECKYCCVDPGDWVTDKCHGDECRVQPTSNQTHRKDRKDDVQRVKTVPEPDDVPYVWFLEEFVQMPSLEFQDGTAEEEEKEKEEEEKQENEEEGANLETENALKKVAGISEKSEDWELLGNEIPSEVEEFHEDDHGILAMLIEDALVRKTTRLQITEGDTRTNRKKNRRRNKTPIEK